MEPSVSVSLTIIRQARRPGSKLFRPNLRPQRPVPSKRRPARSYASRQFLHATCTLETGWTSEETSVHTDTLLTWQTPSGTGLTGDIPASFREGHCRKEMLGVSHTHTHTHTHTHKSVTHTLSLGPLSLSLSLSPAAVEAADPLDWITIFQQRNWNRNSESLHSPTADVAGPTIT